MTAILPVKSGSDARCQAMEEPIAPPPTMATSNTLEGSRLLDTRTADYRVAAGKAILQCALPHRRGRAGQQLGELLGVEPRLPRRAVAARVGAGRDQQELAVLNLLHGGLGEAGFGWIAFVVG